MRASENLLRLILRDPDRATTRIQQGLKHSCGGWEDSGIGSTCHVSAAGSIDCDAIPEVILRAAQVSGVEQDGIDD